MGKVALQAIKGPRFLRFVIPVINVLKELGGSGISSEVQESIIEKYDISADELERVNQNGGSNIKNQIAWVRFYLTKAGIMDSSKRGVWALTEKGVNSNLAPEEVHALFKEIHGAFNTARKSKPSSTLELTEEIEEHEPEQYFSEEKYYKEQLLDILQNKLSPGGFERLCKRILRESGFVKVEVTGKTNDGGIDGIGMLEINPLISFKVLFQCKRWKNNIPPAEIRDFRGAMAGRADKGIFLTTGSFSQEAKKEAVRDGAAPIELVDIEKLIEMLEKLELGLMPRTTFDVDMNFFDEYMESGQTEQGA